ncbi:MAG TPA: AtpZ/AtpI family protein [Gemmatimonadaceae bacterium]|nr:AtpZ/AtpI family protein [Gemmatimonadaceae bacterium]
MPDGKRLGGAGPRAPGPAQGLGGAEFAGLGLQFALAILLFAALGAWLDRRLGSSPWLLLVGVLVGAGGGFHSMYRKITAAQRRDAEARNAARAARQENR